MKNLFITIVLFLVLLLVLFHYNVKENYPVQVYTAPPLKAQVSALQKSADLLGTTEQATTEQEIRNVMIPNFRQGSQIGSNTNSSYVQTGSIEIPSESQLLEAVNMSTKSTPLAPSLSLEINDNDNPQINFVLGDDGGSVITSAYIISVKNNNSENIRLDKIPLEPDKNSYDIELINLERNNNYYFTGVCINSFGMGRLSRPVKSFY